VLCKLPWASGGQKLGAAAWECRKRGVAVPTLLARVLTLALLHVMVGVFWFPPINSYGIMRQGAVNLHSGWQDVKAALAARLT
jgi:hypothetical protein